MINKKDFTLSRFVSLLIICLYLIIAIVSINSVFNGMIDGNKLYSDGIIYLLLDIILIFYCFFISGETKIYKSVMSALILTAYQFIVIFYSDVDGFHLIVMRGITWVLILLVLYLHLSGKPGDFSFTLSLFMISLFVLSILIILNEINLRKNEYLTGINFIYWVELGFPAIFFLKNKKIRLLMFVVIGMSILLSLKLTAIISFFIPLIIGVMLNSNLNSKRSYNKYIFLIFVIVFIYFTLPYLVDWMKNYLGIDWFQKINDSYDSGGSGRSDIWKKVVSLQFNSNFKEWIFGHGYEATIIATQGLSAHNDVLEVLFDYGIIGLWIYISMIYYMMKFSYRCIMHKTVTGTVAVVSLSQFAIMSMFSHLIIYPNLMLTVGIVWALCLSNNA